MMFDGVFTGRRVLVTGHTGFKGAWLCEWLLSLGARVRGFSLDPPTTPSLFDQLGLAGRLDDVRGDIRDLSVLKKEVTAFDPEFVFHLAAQSLVRYSYDAPVETYQTNVMGTVHVLEVLRTRMRPCVGVIVTTDKCYENREWIYGYRESDAMGGSDPYSSSKGMAELAVSAYQRSYFREDPIRVASVRAGNVIGGGDWATDRIVPDCMRALHRKQPVTVRNPLSRRPWQHVLDPLHGYLLLAQKLQQADAGSESLTRLTSGFNFGPDATSNRTVGELVQQVLHVLPGSWQHSEAPGAPHEAALLHLCIDKARFVLGWQPRWEFASAVERTVSWYRDHFAGMDAGELTRAQIAEFEAADPGGDR